MQKIFRSKEFLSRNTSTLVLYFISISKGYIQIQEICDFITKNKNITHIKKNPPTPD